jgi:type I restriction enzyme S subunit
MERLYRITPQLDRLFARSRLRGGEVLISIQGTVGRVALAPAALAGANISRTIARVAVGCQADAKFVRDWLLSDVGQKALDDCVLGTTRDSLNLGVLRLVKIPTPPLAEQRRIAEILGAADEAIRGTEAVIAKLEHELAGLAQELLVPVGRRSAVPLATLVSFAGGYGYPLHLQSRVRNDLPFFKVSDLSTIGNEHYLGNASFFASEELARSQGWRPIPKDAIVYAKVGAALLLNRRRLLSQPSLIDNNMMAAVAGPRVVPKFLYWWLQQVDFGRFVNSGVLPSVNQQQVGSLLFPRISVDDQERAATIMDASAERIAAEGRFLAKLKLEKQALMQDLLTGRVRVNA